MCSRAGERSRAKSESEYLGARAKCILSPRFLYSSVLNAPKCPFLFTASYTPTDPTCWAASGLTVSLDCLRQPVIMELFFLSSRRQRRSHTSPGTERIRTSQFLPMPLRFRQIQAPLLSARLLEKLQPNLTSFHLLVTNESHQSIAMAVESYCIPADLYRY